MSVFVLRVENREGSVDFKQSWCAYVIEIDKGREISRGLILTGHGDDPLGAVSRLATKQAATLSGYKEKR